MSRINVLNIGTGSSVYGRVATKGVKQKGVICDEEGFVEMCLDHDFSHAGWDNNDNGRVYTESKPQRKLTGKDRRICKECRV